MSNGLGIGFGLGIGEGQSALPIPSASFDFTGVSPSIPAGWTYTRGDNLISTRRDSGGVMRTVASNAAPFNYDVNGNGLGILMEPTRTNICTNLNMNPVDLTGVTSGGDAAAVFSCISDSTNLATAKIDQVGNAKVIQIDNTLGSTAATATISGTIGSTSKSSMSAYINCVSGSGLIGTSDGTSTQAFDTTNGVYGRVTLENFTPSGTTIQMKITANAGSKVCFILNQMEVGGNASSVIKVAGASATRSSPTFGDLSITTRSYFNASAGAIVVDFSFEDVANAAVLGRLFGLTDSTNGVANCIGLYRIAPTTRRKAVPQFVIGSTSFVSVDCGSVDAKKERWPAAMSWQDNVIGCASTGADSFVTFPVAGAFATSGINRVYFGCRSSVEQVNGHVRSIKFFKQYIPPNQLGLSMVKSGDVYFATCGQSNGTNLFSAQSGANNSGEVALKAVTDAARPNTRNFYMNGGTVGTTVRFYSGTSNDTNYWLNTDTGALGAPFRRWMSMVQGMKNGTCLAIIDVSGESDAGQCTVQQFVDGLTARNNIMRNILGPVPVIMVPIGRNGSVAAYQPIREAQWQYAAQNPGFVYLAPERFDLALVDGLHITDGATGTTPLGTRIARKLHKVLGDTISGGVDGPIPVSAIRSSNIVTVTLAHDTGGTDFTPTSAIAGFHYYNGADDTATENIITASVRASATTITLTLTSASAGVLYYGHGDIHTDTVANLVHDNSTQALPLRAAKIAVA